MGRPRGHVAAALLLLSLVGCTATSSPGPSPSPAATGDPSASQGGGSPTAAPSGAAGATAGPLTSLPPLMGLDPFPADWPDFPGFLDVPDAAPGGPTPIPAPTLTDPFEIGVGFYDPGQVGAAVASLLNEMGVGIFSVTGAALRPGAGNRPGDLWLTEDEVRGLIEMGIADATAIANDDDGASPFTFADLGAALGPLLPGWSTERLAAAYDDAYAARPDDLIAAMMLGQPIEPATPLTRAQLWFLLVDGFVPPPVTAAMVPGVELAAGGVPWGTASSVLPLIQSPDPAIANLEFALLIAHVGVLGYTIPFSVDPVSVAGHEGHGGPGPTLRLNAAIGAANGNGTLFSPYTGAPMVLPRAVPVRGGQVWWSSPDEGLFNRHGTFGTPLGVPIAIGPSGESTLTYRMRQEEPDPAGPEMREVAAATASISMLDLVDAVYEIPLQARGFVFGTREATGLASLSWHAKEGIDLQLMNQYNLDLVGEGIDLGFGGTAHGAGQDAAAGFLELQDDGNYRGMILARSFGTFGGEWGGAGCTRLHDSAQDLYVVGRPIAGGNLNLAFYPGSAPWFWFPENTCPIDAAWQVGWEGGGPDDRPAGQYIPFGTGRWNTPAVGYDVWRPSESNPEWVYVDDEDSSGFGLSVWYVRTRLVK